MLGDPSDPGYLYAPTTASATVGLKFFWLPELTSTLAFATLRTYAKEGTSGPIYKYGQYLAANLIYNITSRIQIGLEYEAGKRMNYDRTDGNDNRLQAVFTASF